MNGLGFRILRNDDHRTVEDSRLKGLKGLGFRGGKRKAEAHQALGEDNSGSQARRNSHPLEAHELITQYTLQQVTKSPVSQSRHSESPAVASRSRHGSPTNCRQAKALLSKKARKALHGRHNTQVQSTLPNFPSTPERANQAEVLRV